MELKQHAAEREVFMNQTKQQLLHYITEVSFALNDVILFLDTHPDDKEALAYYHKYHKQRMQALNEYESCYGPLLNYNVISENRWTWIDSPWPWEGVC